MEQRTISRMTQKPIRLSALGRDVKVGDLYNYKNDLILKNKTVDLLNENIGSVSAFKNRSFYLKPDDKLKRHILGINSHFNHSINNGALNETCLWFNDYFLQNSSTKEDDKNVAKTDFFFRLKRYTKTINRKHFSDSKMHEYQLFSGGRATHLVEEVVYGAEFICSMRRDFDQSETKENAEKSLQMAAKAYIDEAINPNSISLKEQPKELANVISTNYCSLSDKVKKQCSIQQFCEWLRETVGFDKDFAGSKWQAIEIVFRYIPDQIGAQVLFEMKNDFNLEKEIIRAQFIYIQKESSEISKLPLIDSVPPFEKMIYQFLNLLSKLEKKFNLWDKTDFYSTPVSEKVLSEMEEMSDLFDDMAEWLFKRRINIEKMCLLLKDIKLRMFDLSESKALEPIANEEFAQVFLLKMDYVKDPLLARIQKLIGTPDPFFKLPVFPFLAVGEHRFRCIEESLKSFDLESSSHTNTPYLIGLVTASSPFNDGEIQNLKYFYESKNINQREYQPYLSNSSVSTSREEKNFDSSHPSHQPKNIDEGIHKFGPTERERHQLTEEQCFSTTEDGSKTELTCHIQTETENLSVPPSSILIGNTKDAGKVSNDGSQLTTEILAENLTKKSNQMEPSKVNSEGVLSSDGQNNIAAITENNTDENCQRQSTKKSYTVADRLEISQLIKREEKLDSNMPSKIQTKRMQTNPSIVNSSTCQVDENSAVVQGQVPNKEIDFHRMDQGTTPNVLRHKSQNSTATTQDCNLEENLQRKSKETSEIESDRMGNGQFSKFKGKLDKNTPSKTETENKQTNPSVAGTSSHQDENPAVVQEKLSSMAIDRHTMDQGSIPNEQSVPEKKKIAEVFTQEEFAKLKKDGQRQPMVYQLNTKERSVGENLRHFEITGQKDTVSSSQNSQNHKVIILMGATGSGKSTLINGMINYILGVQWKDPFRFECVREDSSVVRNEAHSQTDSVTAYTLHHREGMTVPYSITLIDTPGYGDTRGIERDKKITGCIHRFLTQQQGFKIDQIHAIFFVAASGNSRLTPTQQYVLDSVLSIFGKDVKENIRLLVTFADNATPPVVEACRAAHFPMTSPSGDVMFNKFNSSVLYASNEKKEDSRIKIKEIMWNMGQRNYKSFFTMLESMNGRDLKSTRQVILHRQLLEQPLQDIEVELEVCFDTIEKLENRCLQQQNSDIEWKTYQNPKFELVLIEKIKVMSLLEQVGKSGRFLDLGALRSYSPSPDECLSLIRSRVADEQTPGYEIRLQTLTELQNWFNENNVDEALKSKSANFPPIFSDKSSGHATQRKGSSKPNPTYRAKFPPYNRQNFTTHSYRTRPPTAATNKRSGPEQSTTVRESHNEVRRNASPIRQSTAGETDKKRSQSTEENSTKVNHDSKIHENPTGCAEDCSYPATSIANVSIHPKSAENSETRYANALATGNEPTWVEVSSDQNASEFDEENPHSSETSSKKSEQKKSISVSGIVSDWLSSLLSKKL